jgi:tRNA A37 threonylcarbamoyladenosine synthetase subunit TsaC/SUA5/YrdC
MPLAATSVNRSGDPPAASGLTAAKLFGSKVEWVIDGGVCTFKEASSVVDVSHFPFIVKRQGAISKKDLERTLFPL